MPSNFFLIAFLLLLGAGCTSATDANPSSSDPAARSGDVERDVKIMWETQPLKVNAGSSAGANPQASTDRAINAASRVFNIVVLVGKTRDEVMQLLGDPRGSSKSAYNFPFGPAPTGALVYRFDSGAYGWQFNVIFEADDKVSAVDRHWIH